MPRGSFVQFWEGRKIQSTCSVFPIYSYFLFHFHFLASQTFSEDFSLEDERLGSLSLGAKVTGFLDDQNQEELQRKKSRRNRSENRAKTEQKQGKNRGLRNFAASAKSAFCCEISSQHF